MARKLILPAVLVVVVAVAALVYFFQQDYKYSCRTDTQCYPCTRFMDCVSEDFYLRNTVVCRGGGEVNLSRIVCGCRQDACQTIEVKPEAVSSSERSVPGWVPQD